MDIASPLIAEPQPGLFQIADDPLALFRSLLVRFQHQGFKPSIDLFTDPYEEFTPQRRP